MRGDSFIPRDHDVFTGLDVSKKKYVGNLYQSSGIYPIFDHAA
jgi:hypothetical protein